MNEILVHQILLKFRSFQSGKLYLMLSSNDEQIRYSNVNKK